jgi:hypothetical protein
MFVLFIILSILITYPAIGFGLVQVFRPGIISRSRILEGQTYTIQHPDYASLTKKMVAKRELLNREAVTKETKQLVFGWPIFLWFVLLNNNNAVRMDKADPEVYARLLRRNKELEAELLTKRNPREPDDLDIELNRALRRR